MADVFLSYSDVDRAIAHRLARALEAEGLSVWFDHPTLAANTGLDNTGLYPELRRRVIAEASAVVVLWSANSFELPYVGNEAHAALNERKLIDVLVGPVNFIEPIPLGVVDLRAWTGSVTSTEFQMLRTQVLSARASRKLQTGDAVISARPSGETLVLSAGGRRIDRIKVAVNSPRQIGADWQTVRAYLYPESDESKVKEDGQLLRQGSSAAQHLSGQAKLSRIRRGTRITVSIYLPNAECRPNQHLFRWKSRWHKSDFEVRYLGRPVSEPQEGTISWFAGMVCVGQIQFRVEFTPEAPKHSESPLSTAPCYESVFVSYSTKDSVIVDLLEATYTALGMTYLRDVRALRSGETWDTRLLQLIKEADLFQLCWSANAKQSTYVADEWRFALGLPKHNFIRPCYWEDPMPEPPPELRRLHFTRLRLNWFTRAWVRLRARFG